MTQTLIQSLHNPSCYDHPIDSIRILETHISWVLLTGDFAYKIKKPINLGFLDFSQLESRHFYCLEEIRLNQRLASSIYIGVIPISGDESHPKINGHGKPIEYAVKMRQFAEEASLEGRTSNLPVETFDELANSLARFHATASKSAQADNFGNPESIKDNCEKNLAQIETMLQSNEDTKRIQSLKDWTRSEHQRLQHRFAERKTEGFIRECHGDLHLGNIVYLKQSLVPFDCIEFSTQLRWIDVIDEMAFLCMDLEVNRQTALSRRLINRYLQITGDYLGLELLNYYQVYRALVRAKVSLLSNQAKYSSYIDYAEKLCQKKSTQLFIMHGFSGSGKSHLACKLSETIPAIWLRSDIERKRLFKNLTNSELYQPELTDQIYLHLLDLSQHLLKAGFSVIVDATFLKKNHRQAQRSLAQQTGSDFKIIDLKAPIELIEQRIIQRLQTNQDPSDATLRVLEKQINSAEPLDDIETQSLFNDNIPI